MRKSGSVVCTEKEKSHVRFSVTVVKSVSASLSQRRYAAVPAKVGVLHAKAACKTLYANGAGRLPGVSNCSRGYRRAAYVCAVLVFGGLCAAPLSAGRAQSMGEAMGRAGIPPEPTATDIQGTKHSVFHSGQGHLAIGGAVRDFKINECSIQYYANQPPSVAIERKTSAFSVNVAISSIGPSFTSQSAIVTIGKIPNVLQYNATHMRLQGKWVNSAQKPVGGPLAVLHGDTLQIKAVFWKTTATGTKSKVPGQMTIICGNEK